MCKIITPANAFTQTFEYPPIFSIFATSKQIQKKNQLNSWCSIWSNTSIFDSISASALCKNLLTSDDAKKLSIEFLFVLDSNAHIARIWKINLLLSNKPYQKSIIISVNILFVFWIFMQQLTEFVFALKTFQLTTFLKLKINTKLKTEINSTTDAMWYT